MAIDPNVARAIMKEEVGAALLLAPTFGWVLCVDAENLRLCVRLTAHNGDRFVVEMTFDNYREVPAAIDFVDLATGTERGASVFPKGRDTFFHTAGPCICAPINRKAYRLPDQPNGIHADWRIGDWANSTAQGFAWRNFSTIAGVLFLIQTRLDRAEEYHGRMSA